MSFNVPVNLIGELAREKYSKVQVFSALNKETLNLREFASLVTFDDKELFEHLAQKSKTITDIKFGKSKGLYIPLYLSNACDNVCSYCGFKNSNKIERYKLKDNEIKEELEFIYNKGFRSILLVSGESASNICQIKKAISFARDIGFQYISLEIGVLDEKVLKDLSNIGANSFVLYQETYHRPTYETVHVKGKKTNYESRLNAIDKALDNGFKHVTLGFLGGLYDPLFEVLSLFSHLTYLRKKYKDKEFVLSIPRITNATGVNKDFINISDKKFAQILMSLRIAFPDVSIYLSTREKKSFRDGMLNICATHLSVESKTSPGGYKNSAKDSLEQFKTLDNRNLDEVKAGLKKLGYDVYFKNWNIELNY